MKPERKRNSSRQAEVARGRMYIKSNLYWLNGCPVAFGNGEIEWLAFNQADGKELHLRLTRESLRKATFAWNKLINQYDSILPHIIENSEAWKIRVPLLLDILKGYLNHQRDLPKSLFHLENVYLKKWRSSLNASIKSCPGCEDIFNAVSWVSFLNPEQSPLISRWIAGWNPSFKEYVLNKSLPDAITCTFNFRVLWQCSTKDTIDYFIKCLTNRKYQTISTVDVYPMISRYIKEIRSNGRHFPEFPEPNYQASFDSFLDWIINQKPEVKSSALKLFKCTFPESAIDRWRCWWDESRTIFNHAKHAPPATYSSKKEYKDLISRLDDIKSNTPPTFNLDIYFKYLSASAEQFKADSAVGEILDLIPLNDDQLLGRIVFLINLNDLSKEYPRKYKFFLPTLKNFLAENQAVPGLMKPWEKILKTRNLQKNVHSYSFTDTLLEDYKKPTSWKIILSTLAGYIKKYPDCNLTGSDADNLAVIANEINDIELSHNLFHQLITSGLKNTYLYYEDLLCAMQLTTNPQALPRIIKQITKAGDNDDAFDLSLDSIKSFVTFIKNNGWPDLPEKLIIDGEFSSFITLCEFYRMVSKHTKISSLPSHDSSEKQDTWFDRYPQLYCSLLRQLAAWSPNGKKTADRILRNYYPSADELQNEIRQLKQRSEGNPKDQKIIKRIENLKSRIDIVPLVSTQRQSVLYRKLEKAVRKAILTDWTDYLQSQAKQIILSWLDLTEAPDWILTREQNRIFAWLDSCKPSTQKLAKQLYRVRCGERPWDLRNHPANLKFISSLEHKGINVDPWINPARPETVHTEDGRVITLVFEDDPLNIFQMGWHFNTCLSPGGCNFFSVFANAADINKRVVYAYDKQKLVGRCLLALCQDGRILTFNPYCHDKSIKFGKLIQNLVKQLASEMGTVAVTNAAVPTLVATQWYDDGAQDICGTFQFLKNDNFINPLKTIPLNEFPGYLKGHFDPLGLDGLTVPMIIWLKEVQERPELIVPLIPYIESCGRLSHDTWLQIAKLVYKTDNHKYLHKVLSLHIEPYFKKLKDREWMFDWEIMDVIVLLEPSMALRILKSTRPKNIRSIDEETNPKRINIYKKALLALSRPGQAARLQEKGRAGPTS